MSSNPVIILGAGIGGLTLGRCLKLKGITAIIYDRAPNKPRHTYGITLESWAYRPLLKYLDIDESAFKQRLAVDALRTGRSEKYFKHGNIADDPTYFRANRFKLEKLLREGLEVKAEHQLSSAVLNSDKTTLELLFKHGLKVNASSSLVIDTMGVHSPLRQALLPDLSPTILPFVVFNGKRKVSSELFRDVYSNVLGDENILTTQFGHSNHLRVEVAVNEYQDDGNVSISYIYSRKAMTEGPDLLHRPNRTQAEATDINEEFYNEVKSIGEDTKIAPVFRDIFDIEKLQNDRILHWLMRTILVPEHDLQDLLAANIVLLGDASHATPILGGKGANSAITDAIELAEVISTHKPDKDAITKFYKTRWRIWKKEDAASLRQIEEMHQGYEARL